MPTIVGIISQLDLLILPNLATELVDEGGDRDETNCDEAEQGVSPTDAEGGVHLGSGEGQEGRDDAPHHGEGGEGACGVLRVGINEIGLDRKPDSNDAEAKGNEADDRDDPVDSFVGGPAVPEEGDGQKEGEVNAVREAHLGLVDAAVGLGHAHDGLVGEGGEDAEASHVADEEGQVDDTRDADRPAVAALKDDGDGIEEEVEAAVGEGDVKRDAKDDGGPEEKTDRACQAVEEDAPSGEHGGVRVDVAAAELWPAELLAKAFCLSADEHLVVSLAVQEDHGADNEGGRDEGNPVNPAPADGLGDEATDDGSTRGPEHGTQHPDGHGPTALTDGEQVGDDSAANGLAGRTTQPAHEAEEDESAEGRSEGAADEPGAEEGVCGGDDDVAAVDLGQGREDQGADGVAQEEDADRYRRYSEVGLVEIGGDIGNGRGEDGRCKGRHEGDGGEQARDEPLARLREVERVLGVMLALPTDDAVVEIHDGVDGRRKRLLGLALALALGEAAEDAAVRLAARICSPGFYTFNLDVVLDKRISIG